MRTLIFIFVIVLPSLLSATIHTFDPGDSVQQAVNDAQAGDTIILVEGYYDATVVLYGKTLVIGSEFLLDGDTSHIPATFVQPDMIHWNMHPDTHSCFIYAYGEGEGSELAGLTMGNGFGSRWIAYEGTTYIMGGCIFACSTTVTIRNCVIQNGTAEIGAGIMAGSRGRRHCTSLRMTDCNVNRCYASYWGGGVGANWADVRLERCDFFADSCLGGGGAVHIMDSDAQIRSCDFRGCVGQIGGLALMGCFGEVTMCVFDSNATRVFWEGPCHLGMDRSPMNVTGCLFRRNAIDYPPIQMAGRVDSPPLKFWGNVVEDNFYQTVNGTMYCAGVGLIEVGYCVIRNNVGWRNPGIIVQTRDPRLRIHHNVIENNRSYGLQDGSAIYLQYNCRVIADSNVIRNNSSPAVGLEDERFHQHFENNWWGDASGPYHPTLNPLGLGDTLYQDSILFIPWLTEPPDTTMPSGVSRERPEVLSTWRLIEVYPNPFNSTMRLILAGFSGKDFRVTLHNLLGQEVAELHRGAMTGGEIVFTAPPHLASGVYFVRAADHLAMESRKVILLK